MLAAVEHVPLVRCGLTSTYYASNLKLACQSLRTLGVRTLETVRLSVSGKRQRQIQQCRATVYFASSAVDAAFASMFVINTKSHALVRKSIAS